MNTTVAATPQAGQSRMNWLGRLIGESPGAGKLSLAALPPVVGPVVSGVGVTVVGLAVLFILGGNYYDSMFVLALSYAFVTLGMVVQLGYAHQLAFSQSVFMGVGAYGVAILNTKYGWPVPLAIVACVAGTSLLGLIIGRAVCKSPGFALALATLFFSVIVTSFVVYSNYLGGSTGLGGIAAIWSGSTYTSTLERSGAVVVVLFGICFFVCARILKSGIGLELAFLGTNERMAASIGVITQRRKLECFVLGCALASLGGALFAGTQAFVSSISFDQAAQLSILIMLFIGGRASLYGSLIGAIGIEYLSGTNNWVAVNLQIIEGVFFTLILLFAPGGLSQLLKNVANAGLRKLRAVLAPTQTSDTAESELEIELAGEPVAPAGVFGGEESSSTAAVNTTEFEAARIHLSDAFGSGVSPADRDEVTAQLECEHLTKRFGGLVAVDDVSIAIRGLGIHAICGPNGAGKTTLFELIAGGIPSDSGRVFLAGHETTNMAAFERAELGMARTLQAVRLMPFRSVLENVAVAAVKSHHTFMPRAIFRSDLKEAHERAREAIEGVGIGHLLNVRAGRLTLEAQRMVEFARAIVARPRILLLDEPASGLSTEQRARLSDTLVALGEQMTIVLVEHDLEMVARISREVFVLVHGGLAFQGTASEFLESSIVKTELMGLIDQETIPPIETVRPQ